MQNTALKWISKCTRSAIVPVIICSVCNALTALAAVFLALTSRTVIDIATGTVHKDFTVYCVILFVIIAFEVALNITSTTVRTMSEARLVIKMKNRIFPILLSRKYYQISTYHSGDLVNRLSSDVDIVANSVISIIPTVVSQVTKIVSCISALFILSPAIAAFIIPFGAVILFSSKLLRSKYKALHKECQQTDSVIKSFFQECFQNIAVIKSFLSGKPIIARLNTDMRKNYRAKINRNIARIALSMTLFLVFSCGYYAALVWGASNISKGLTYGTLMGFLQLISQLRAPLQGATGIIPTYYSAIASAERLIELEQLDEEVPALPEHKLESIRNNFTEIIADNLSFGYDGHTVLCDTSFKIERNSITAVCGESGSGKSTFFKLLLGLIEPDSGRMYFNTGDAITSATRALFAYVPQGNMLLSGTIRDNITFCRNDIPEERIIWAAETAAIYDFIETLPDKLDTVISERGNGLSEGQIQRIAIARALLSDTEILLLDESTSAIDEHTEQILMHNLKSLENKTVLFITHRATSLDICQHILRLKDDEFYSEK